MKEFNLVFGTIVHNLNRDSAIYLGPQDQEDHSFWVWKNGLPVLWHLPSDPRRQMEDCRSTTIDLHYVETQTVKIYACTTFNSENVEEDAECLLVSPSLQAVQEAAYEFCMKRLPPNCISLHEKSKLVRLYETGLFDQFYEEFREICSKNGWDFGANIQEFDLEITTDLGA